MAVEAHLADGTVLQFPDDTDPEVVKATVRKQIGAAGARRAQAPPPPDFSPSLSNLGSAAKGVGSALWGAVPEGIKHPSMFGQVPGALADLAAQGEEPTTAMMMQAGKDIGGSVSGAYQKARAQGLPPIPAGIMGAVSSYMPGAPEAGYQMEKGIREGKPSEAYEAGGKGAGEVALMKGLPELPGALYKGAGKVTSGLREGAAESFAKTLKPAGVPAAEQAMKAGAKMAEEPQVALTTKGVQRWVEQKLAETGPAVKAAVDNNKDLPVDGNAIADEILQSAQSGKYPNPRTGEMLQGKGYLSPRTGRVYEASRQAYETLQKWADEARAELGPDATVGDLYNLRRNWDKTVDGIKSWTEESSNINRAELKDASNVLRDHLNQIPEIREANANYGPWEDARSLLEEAEGRGLAAKLGQKGLGSLYHGGLGAGMYYGLRVAGGHATGFAYMMGGLLGLNKLRNSAFWNTLSGSTKALLSRELGGESAVGAAGGGPPTPPPPIGGAPPPTAGGGASPLAPGGPPPPPPSLGMVPSTRPVPTSSTGSAVGQAARQPTALLMPFSKAGKTVAYQWETPGEKVLSGEFATREEAIANRPAGHEHLDDGYQPLPEDVAAVKPRATPPELEVVRRSGGNDEVVLRFAPSSPPLSMAEVNSMFPKARISRLGLDTVLDSAGAQKFRLTFPDAASAKTALGAFGPDVQIGAIGR
jgi:hypothetical protein